LIIGCRLEWSDNKPAFCVGRKLANNGIVLITIQQDYVGASYHGALAISDNSPDGRPDLLCHEGPAAKKQTQKNYHFQNLNTLLQN